MISLLGALCALVVVQGENLPILYDLGDLHLKLERVTQVDAVQDFQSRLAPNPGQKMWVVRLTGKAVKPCIVAAEIREMVAVYLKPGTEPVSNRIQIKLSDAINLDARAGGWAILPARATGGSQSVPVKEPGPVHIDVAFILSANVTEFNLRIPSALPQKVKLGTSNRVVSAGKR